MARYRSRRMRFKHWQRWERRPTKADRLANLFGEAVGWITSAFLALEPAELDRILTQYGEKHGVQAENYARKAFPDWKSGATKLSGQTMERLIALVPPHLSAATRYALLQEVLKKQPTGSRGKISRTIRISTREPEPGFAEIDGVLQSLRHEDSLAHISEYVMNAARWLYDDDMTAARAMLAAATSRENEIIKASAIREIELLRRTVLTGQVKEASYRVEMPAGNLNVEVFTPSRTFKELLFG